MKRIVAISCTCIILVIFVLIMNSGGVLKEPFGDEEGVETLLQKLDEDILNGNWKKGIEDIDKLKKEWKIVSKRVQFSIERNDLLGIELSIARLNGSLRGENREQSLIGLEELKSYWENLEE